MILIHGVVIFDQEGDSVLIDGDRIHWVGYRADMPPVVVSQEVNGVGCTLTPGLIDCHTHLVWAGSRADEFARRLQGESYADIARSGGGIQSTVRATREATQGELLDSASQRLQIWADSGCTRVEIKSGYGLDWPTEARMLRAAIEAGARIGMKVSRTFLAAHACPPGRDADEYIDEVCREMIPAVAREGLADAVDAFCETIAFSPDQLRRVFRAARAHGLRVKLHADQLSDSGGGALAAEFGALSADHVEYTSPESVAAMAKAGTVATLLPGAFYYLRETQRPPVEEFRRQGVPMAVATDCNPGSSPLYSALMAMNMACVIFGLTPHEALLGVTKHAAMALGIEDEGQIRPGFKADLALWSVDHPRELAARMGDNPLIWSMREGEIRRGDAS